MVIIFKHTRPPVVKKIKPLKYNPPEEYKLLPQVEHNETRSYENNERVRPVDSNLHQSRKVNPGKLDDSLPRFGPLYGTDQQSMLDAKKNAWQRVKKNSSEEDPGLTKENYVAAIRRVEKRTREIYGAAPISGTSSEFRLRMIKDGCFFLQLAFLILGKSKELGYSEQHPIFGRKPSRRPRDIKKWIESMFFVGNQIPLIVLNEFMKEKFFQRVIEKGNWEMPPSSLGKRVLYELLVLPELKNRPELKRPSLIPCRKENNLIHEDVSDLLSALQSLVLGPAPREKNIIEREVEAEEDDLDLEANEEDIGLMDQERTFQAGVEYSASGSHLQTFLNAIGLRNTSQNRKSDFPSATELMQSGIRIKKLKFGGARGISFENYYFIGFLRLPVLPVDSNTEIILRNLKAYEINQERENSKLEVSSYLKFMSDIIQTPQDVKLLWSKGILEGDFVYADKLPDILARLSFDETRLTPEFHYLKRKITEFSSPLIRYQGIVNFVVFLTLLQTFFAMLAYFLPPKEAKEKGH